MCVCVVVVAVFWGCVWCGAPNHRSGLVFIAVTVCANAESKHAYLVFCRANQTSIKKIISFHSHLLISSPIVVKQELVKWQVMEGGWSFPDAELYLTLTSSAQLCGLPRHCIPPATCPLGEWASGRSAWTPVCLCTSASPGTGIAAPSDIHLGAAGSGNNQGVKRKQALFTSLNSSGQVPPAWSSHQSRAILKDRLAYKLQRKLLLAWELWVLILRCYKKPGVWNDRSDK